MTEVSDRIFAAGSRQLGLFDLFAAIAAGDSFELTHPHPHQRAPTVTALAVMMTALRRYASGPLDAAADWEREWLAQVGPDALRLVAPETEVGFLQPPLEPAKNRSEMTLSDIDLTFTKALHAAKPLADGTAEEAVFSLFSGAWGIHVSKWNPSTRQCPSVVLPSDDATLAGEVRHLIGAYEARASSIIGANAAPSRAADHFLWLRPVSDAGITVDTVPYPYLEARPCHLVAVADGRYAGVGQHSVPSRLAGKGHADDPHVPLIDGKPYRLWSGRVWSMESQHAMLFGSTEVIRPSTLSVTGYRAVRLCALGVDKGKTLGYWEALYPLTQRAVFSLTASPARAADLSQRALDAADEVDGVLRWAVDALVEGSGQSAAVKAAKSRAGHALSAALTEPLTTTVLALLAEPSDPAVEQQALLKTAVVILRAVWAQLETGCPDPLRRAEGAGRLGAKIHKLTGETTMTEHPDLAKRVYATLHSIAEHLTPNDQAQMRTMLATTPPMLYWLLLGQVQRRLMDTPATEGVWRAVLPALGALRLGGTPIGKALAQTDYPEMRVRQLLTATGETLVAQVAEVVRWLAAHEATAVDLATVTALALADALGDEVTRDELRQQVAMSWVRAQAREAAA
jgi:DNA-binding transcriptional regulator YdaS (Cro superfamily)